MSFPTPSNFTVFISNADTILGQAYAMDIPLVHPTIATTTPSSSEQVVHGWTGMLPKGRVWAGPRVTNEPAPQTYTVVNLPWEETIKIDRFRLDDDQAGVLYRVLPDMARQAKRMPDYWLRDLLENSGAFTGTAQNGLDGLTHFNTAHPINLYNAGAGTYANKYTGGGFGGVGGAFGVNSLSQIVEAMMSRKGEDGERLGVTPSHVMIPNELRLEANLVLKSMFMAPPSFGSITGQVGAADNPMLRFGLEVLVNEHLTSTTNFYVLDCTKSFKPFGIQMRQAPVLAMRTAETDPIMFDEHSVLYGYFGRMAPHWSFAWLSSVSGP
jgi:phage major head subunit gpT-like protein